MARLRNTAWRRLRLQLLCGAAIGSSVITGPASVSSIAVWSVAGSAGSATASDQTKANEKTPPPLTLRWSEEQPGCTFSRGDDGKYHYGLWSGEVGIVLAVDAREVQIIRHRIEPVFGVLLEIHYRGADSLDANPAGITMQFMKHFKVVQPALDPDDYPRRIQADADTLDDETRRKINKHPEQKQPLEASLQGSQKSYNELIEFFARDSLRPAHLDRAHPETSGWVFFDTNNKWLGKWKEQEEFILRLPLAGKIFEFPFKLPPRQ